MAPITSCDGFKALALLFPFDKLWPGHRRCAFTPPTFPYVNDPIRFGYRQWSKQYSVDDAEYGGVRADAERERERRYSGEAGIFQQLSERESKIVHREAEFGLFLTERDNWINARRVARRNPTRD